MAACGSSLINLIIIRHGLSEGNVAARDASVRTVEFNSEDSYHYRLTTKGIEQAQEVGQWVRENFKEPIDAYVCSPYARTQETAGHMQLPGATWILESGLEESGAAKKDDGLVAKGGGALAVLEKTKKARHYRAFIRSMQHVDEFLTRYVFMNYLQVTSMVVVCHANVMRFLRFRMEHMTPERMMRPIRVENTELIWYTRRHPADSGVLLPKLSWRLRVKDRRKPEKEFKVIRPITFTNEDLLSRIEKTSPKLSACQ